MSKDSGLLELSDEVIESVSDWAVEMIVEITQALNPSELPFDHEDQSIEDQIIDYIELRGNPDAWLRFIEDQSQTIIKKLQDAGVPNNSIVTVHPFDIAVKYAINYSAYMEEELRKRA